MIRHIVILHFQRKFHQNFLDLLEKTRRIINQIPGIENFQIFENKSRYVPKDAISFGIEITFKDENALEQFMNDPRHYQANAIFEEYLADPPYMVLTHKI